MSDQDPPPPPPPPPPPSGGFPPPPMPPPAPGGSFGTPPPAGYAPYSAQPPAGDAVGAPRASFGARLGGWVIDALIMGAMAIPAWIALVSGPTHLTQCTVDSSGDITGFGGEANTLCTTPTGTTIGLAVVLGLAALVGAFVYQAKLAGGPGGQTVGMKVVGAKVVDAATGGPIGSGRAVGRFLFGATISGWFCYLGYLWNLWDAQKQTWHDKVTSAVVIKT